MGLKSHDLAGKQFGRLTAVCRGPKGTRGRTRWQCQCECGGERIVYATDLMSGHTSSCGCLQAEVRSANGRATGSINCAAAQLAATTHGHSSGGTCTPTYYSWVAMKDRCLRPGHTRWADYGGRGIKVCDRWLTFENFLADMGERPDGTTLDRYPDNDGDYEAGNCRWATPKQQRANQRRDAA